MREYGTVERLLFETLLPNGQYNRPNAVFILGAPRTGSTVLYQALCSRWVLPYISNFTNSHFAQTPIVGLTIQKALPADISFVSRYGKTSGALQPSEGSALLSRWFGGGHPSAVVSHTILEGMSEHFLSTLSAAETLFQRPLVIKNPWNCFRIRYLAGTLPHARFVWIRRDIAAAAKSDLAARYATKGSPNAWNSATPANVEELRRLPPTQQVVENQREFNAAIGDDLKTHAAGRWAAVCYEGFCRDPEGTLEDLARALGLTPVANPPPMALRPVGDWELPIADETAIDSYVAKHVIRTGV